MFSADGRRCRVLRGVDDLHRCGGPHPGGGVLAGIRPARARTCDGPLAGRAGPGGPLHGGSRAALRRIGAHLRSRSGRRPLAMETQDPGPDHRGPHGSQRPVLCGPLAPLAGLPRKSGPRPTTWHKWPRPSARPITTRTPTPATATNRRFQTVVPMPEMLGTFRRGFPRDWPEEVFGQFRMWVAANETALEHLAEGARRPCYCPVYTGPTAMLAGMPEAAGIRAVAFVLDARIKLRAFDGQDEQLLSDVATLYRFACHLGGVKVLSHQLVGVSIRTLLTGTLRGILANESLPPADAGRPPAAARTTRRRRSQRAGFHARTARMAGRHPAGVHG